jgi:hypothetical protein
MNIQLKHFLKTFFILVLLSLVITAGTTLETGKGFFTGADDGLMLIGKVFTESIRNDSFAYVLGLFAGFSVLVWFIRTGYQNPPTNKEGSEE